MVSQGQQGPYFINGESERPGTADEGESLEMNCPVAATDFIILTQRERKERRTG